MAGLLHVCFRLLRYSQEIVERNQLEEDEKKHSVSKCLNDSREIRCSSGPVSSLPEKGHSRQEQLVDIALLTYSSELRGLKVMVPKSDLFFINTI